MTNVHHHGNPPHHLGTAAVQLLIDSLYLQGFRKMKGLNMVQFWFPMGTG